MIEKIKDIDKHWKILTISIVLVFISGVLPSLWVCDWEWFSRSGALLVIYGIYIVWLDYKGRINTDLDTIESHTIKKFGDKAGELTGTLDNIRVSNNKLYARIEFLILTFGTAIWGYGDLVGNLYS
jgi:hypothetical protein